MEISVEEEWVPTEINISEEDDYIMDMDFHPSQNVIAMGHITGIVQVYRYAQSEQVYS
jgi:hypothetical protein